jgi:hypothetical protein
MTTATFETETTAKAPEALMPQTAGSKLWVPMFVMALMGFAVGIVLAFVRSNAIFEAEFQDAAALGHFVPAAMFFGFAAVFAAISFAIARILGELRVGGGSVQEAVGSEVTTLKMPKTGKAFIGLMAMAMMLLLGAVIVHIFAGIAILDGETTGIASAQAVDYLEAARRVGVSVYLLSITFGLATIIQVLRFQSIRIRDLASAVTTR